MDSFGFSVLTITHIFLNNIICKWHFVLFLGLRILLTSFTVPQTYALVILYFWSLCLAHRASLLILNHTVLICLHSLHACPAFLALPLCILDLLSGITFILLGVYPLEFPALDICW